MNEKSMRILEFPKILNMLEDMAGSLLGKDFFPVQTYLIYKKNKKKQVPHLIELEQKDLLALSDLKI